MTISISITSGKGGVGKTNCAVNLALSLRKIGKKVLLFDADFGMANAHILLGINPDKTVADFLNNKALFNEIIVKTYNDLSFIAGGSALLELLNLNNQSRYELIRAFDDLNEKFDYLIVDTPAGGAENTLFFTSATDITLVVTVAEPTSFLDAYALIKAANHEKKIRNYSILFNMAENLKSASQNFDNFYAICNKFLDINLHYTGMIPLSNAIRRSIIKRKPIVVDQPDAPETGSFNKIAKSLVYAPRNKIDGIKFFSNSIINENQ